MFAYFIKINDSFNLKNNETKFLIKYFVMRFRLLSKSSTTIESTFLETFEIVVDVYSKLHNYFYVNVQIKNKFNER